MDAPASGTCFFLELVTGPLGEDPAEEAACATVEAAARAAGPMRVIGRDDRRTYVYPSLEAVEPVVAVLAPLIERYRWWTLSISTGPLAPIPPRCG